MKCDHCPAAESSGGEYPESYCAAGVPEKSMTDFADGTCGCRYSKKEILKRREIREEREARQWDGIETYADDSFKTEQAMRLALSEALQKAGLVLCYKSSEGTLYEASMQENPRVRELPAWLRWAYQDEEEKVQQGFCEKCRWKTRHQKCSCCRRNRRMRDNYEPAGKEEK